MGYIDGFEDIMEWKQDFSVCNELLKKDYANELKMLKVELPKVDKIRWYVLTRQKNWYPKNITAGSATHMIWSRKKKR